MNSNQDHLRYPTGKFVPQEVYSSEDIKLATSKIETLPDQLKSIIQNFTSSQFNTPYREGGWTGKQVIHHLADSHMNAYIRLKWTLTEDTPIIKAYNEKAWADTPETALDPVVSVNLLSALHIKWVSLLKLLKADELQREFVHPETKNHVRVDRLINLYAWHGQHHLGHLKIIAGLK